MINATRCHGCGSIVEYDESDISLGPIVLFNQIVYVECPECGELISIGTRHP